ncbi:PIR Superfamily Protein [Plasmodium ovale wallikeri]|uniref:PIR Superfamily Protein n=1 Tax=Plasmodium ovale wallikeri TaxID=864142 RepID=A0A1A9AKY2_PLAOA|nr:PIR Superfamily Protein [Plasmodium ovale wallikeri]SBT57281.1 PIR Superfamily Protein [Plasmodium ovale wallikeri]
MEYYLLINCPFFDISGVQTIYEEFLKICESNSNSQNIQKCITDAEDDSNYCSTVADKVKELKNKFNQMLQTYHRETYGIYSERDVKDVKNKCLCLKHSFYNEIIKDDNKLTNVYKLLKICNSEIKNKMNDIPSNLCTFRTLNFRGIKKMKTIFDFYLFYYRNIKDIPVDRKLKTHSSYLKKGFYEHCNGIIECLTEKSNSEYCDEFKEYHHYYNAFKVFLEGLIFYGKEADGSDCDNGCVLAESLLKGNYLLELKEEIKRIKSKYSSTNYSTTVTTITPRELWIRTLKLINKEAHANLDDETESNSLVTSEYLENNSKRKGYSISYKSTKYS